MSSFSSLIESSLANEIHLSELIKKQGNPEHQLIEILYEYWRSQKLRVVRGWNDSNSKGEEITYHGYDCFLPSDKLSLREKDSNTKFLLATWNINSIRVRLNLILSWLREKKPDIVCFQETKVEDDKFPKWEFESIGYNVVTFGQKSYNGVAIISKYPLDNVQYGFMDNFDSENKRVLWCTANKVRICNVYVPQGASVDSDKFTYKLNFLDKLYQEVFEQQKTHDMLVVAGDFNIAPDERDIFNPEAHLGKVSFHPDEHSALNKLKNTGMKDAFRLFNKDGEIYSWWDFRTRGFERNEGMRIDHIWISNSLVKRCKSCEIDASVRSKSRPSDHAPVIANF